MPRVIQIKNGGIVTVAYSIDHSVGPGAANKREDVLLVQHLLRLAWQTVPASQGFRPPGEKEPLKADGIHGPTTQRFIKFFQEEAKRRGAAVAQDGRIDPAITGASRSSLSQTMYTILALNSARNSRAPQQNDIAADPGFPTELFRHFYIDWSLRL
jgi:hypothetical protein